MEGGHSRHRGATGTRRREFEAHTGRQRSISSTPSDSGNKCHAPHTPGHGKCWLFNRLLVVCLVGNQLETSFDRRVKATEQIRVTPENHVGVEEVRMRRVISQIQKCK